MKIIIGLLRAIVGFAFFIVFIFFANHIFGFVFGIQFKSVGKVTGELILVEIAALGIIGAVYWGLEVLHKKIGSSSFDNAMREAIIEVKNGNDKGKDILLSNSKNSAELVNSIEKYEPWATKFEVTQNQVSGAGPIMEYGTKVNISHKDGLLTFGVNDGDLASIIVHLLIYHDRTILDNGSTSIK